MNHLVHWTQIQWKVTGVWVWIPVMKLVSLSKTFQNSYTSFTPVVNGYLWGQRSFMWLFFWQVDVLVSFNILPLLLFTKVYKEQQWCVLNNLLLLALKINMSVISQDFSWFQDNSQSPLKPSKYFEGSKAVTKGSRGYSTFSQKLQFCVWWRKDYGTYRPRNEGNQGIFQNHFFFYIHQNLIPERKLHTNNQSFSQFSIISWL